MRNGLARFREEFPSDNIEISLALGNAIRSDNQHALNQLITTHFSRPETRGFLDGAIAVYIDDDEEVHIHPPAILAVMSGSRNALRAILKSTRNPNAREDPDAPENSPTLLIKAVLRSDIEMVKLLLEEGANVNEEYVGIDEDGRLSSPLSALGFAVYKGLTKTANLLLDNGAVPSYRDAIDAINTSKELDPLLVKMIGLRPELLHEPTADKVSLLHIASTSNNLPSIKGLLDQGAKLNAISNDGTTPLDWAVDDGKKEIAAFLQSVGGVSGKREESPELQNSSAAKKEITKIIERLELLEEKFGIAISGIYASCEETPWNRPTGDYRVIVNFDISSLNGDALARSLHICASAYNSAGQLLSKQESHIDKDDFAGFASIDITLYLDQMPERIRLFPTV